MVPQIAIRCTSRFKNSYPDPIAVYYELMIYKTDHNGRIEGRATFDLETNRLSLVRVYRYDDHGNKILEMDVKDGKAKEWVLYFYSKKNYLVCQQSLENSEMEGVGISQEYSYFYDAKGARLGRENAMVMAPLGLTRTLHEYSPVAQHPRGSCYLDYRIINANRDATPNEYFVLDARGNQVEYGEVREKGLAKRDEFIFDSNDIEIEAIDYASDGEIVGSRKTEVYPSLDGMDRYLGNLKEFDSVWEATKAIQYPKSHHEQTAKRLIDCEQRFGLRQPFQYLEHESDYSDMKVLSEIGGLAEQANDGDSGGRLLSQIEAKLKILEPRLYYRLTLFTDDIVAEMYMAVMSAAMESDQWAKVMRFGQQSQEFNQGKNDEVECWTCMNILAAAMDLHYVTKNAQLLKDAHAAYVSLKKLLEQGRARPEGALMVIRFMALVEKEAGDLPQVSSATPSLKPAPPTPAPKPKAKVVPPAPAPTPPPKQDDKRSATLSGPPITTMVAIGALVLTLVIAVIIVINAMNKRHSDQGGTENQQGSGGGDAADALPDLRTSEGVVRGFVYYMGKREYRKAYDLGVNVPAWRSFSEFSAPSGFGGIDSTALHRITEFPVNADRTKFEVEVFMRDPINGDGTFVQEFDLGFIDEWKILGHRTLSSDRPQDNFKFEVKVGKKALSDREILSSSLRYFPNCQISGNMIVGCHGSTDPNGSPEETTVGFKHYFKQKGNTRALVLLQTTLSGDDCDGEPYDPYHAESGFTSACLYELREGNWVALAFTKQVVSGGGWGLAGEIGKPLQFGLENVAVPVRSGYMGQGTMLGQVSYIGIVADRIREIVSFQNSIDDSGNNGTTCWEIKDSFWRQSNARYYTLRLERSDCARSSAGSSKSVEIEMGADGKYAVPSGFDE